MAPSIHPAASASLLPPPARDVERPREPLVVVPAAAVEDIVHVSPARLCFQVPAQWKSPVSRNPYAVYAERRVLEWFAALGCTPSELARARRFDAAGYVGIPFPMLSPEKTVRVGKYLSLWLLWDDVHVESLQNRWRITAADVRSGRRPEGMTRFDEGWWQLLQEFAEERSERWIADLCDAMEVWNTAAAEEAVAMQRYRDEGMLPSAARQLELRIATIGMYATVYLLEDCYGHELPREFHAHPTVRRLKRLANKIVGLGNDVFSFGKDYSENQINLISTLMHEYDLSGVEALEQVVQMHDESLKEFDELATSLDHWSDDEAPFVERWLRDVRYASLGFSLWEANAPRYCAYKMVVGGQVIEPGFRFAPAAPRG